MASGNDQQPTRATRNDAAKAKYLRGLAKVREGSIEAAEALIEIERCRHFECEACGSIEEFAVRNGANEEEARRLVLLGRATAAKPAIKELVLEGQVPVESGSTVAKVLTKPEMQRAGDDWLKWAQQDTPKEFRRRVAERVEEVRSKGEPVSTRPLTAKERVWDKFLRARTLASRSARTTLTEGETLEVLSDSYLDLHDPLRVAPRADPRERAADGAPAGPHQRRGAARRMPETEGMPGRKIAAEEQRKILARGNDRCQFPGCTNRVWLQYAHIRPHSHGSGREARDILRLCFMHHRMLDSGLIRVSGPADKPAFTDREGRPLGGRGPPAPGTNGKHGTTGPPCHPAG